MWGVVIKRDIAVTPWVQEEKGLEAPPGFEPGIKDLQSSALPLGHGAMGLAGSAASVRNLTRHALATMGSETGWATVGPEPGNKS